MSALNLFDAIALAPSLPGAKCRGRHRLFDPPEPGADPAEVADAQAAALKLCAACTSLPRCAAWVESLPPTKRPDGVVGGTVRAPRRVGRPRRSA